MMRADLYHRTYLILSKYETLILIFFCFHSPFDTLIESKKMNQKLHTNSLLENDKWAYSMLLVF